MVTNIFVPTSKTFTLCAFANLFTIYAKQIIETKARKLQMPCLYDYHGTFSCLGIIILFSFFKIEIAYQNDNLFFNYYMPFWEVGIFM
jgi:hypothetical protein